MVLTFMRCGLLGLPQGNWFCWKGGGYVTALFVVRVYYMVGGCVTSVTAMVNREQFSPLQVTLGRANPRESLGDTMKDVTCWQHENIV